eukprot:6462901-Amphidinium_carterae.3
MSCDFVLQPLKIRRNWLCTMPFVRKRPSSCSCKRPSSHSVTRGASSIGVQSRKRRCSSIAAGVQGPHSVEDLWGWSNDVAGRLLALQDWKESSPFKLWVTTAYSGMGSGEAAIARACKVLGKACEAKPSFHSAWEVDAACRSVLCSRACVPQHVFGDLMNRLDSKGVDEVAKLQQKFRARLRSQGATVEKCSSEFLVKACEILERTALVKECWCYQHNTNCKWIPDFDEQCQWIDVGGNTCTPWSNRGSKQGWLAEVSLPCLVWLFSLKKTGFALHILNECVPSFPASIFQMVFPGADVSAVKFAPSDVGVWRANWNNKTRQTQIVHAKAQTHA